MPSVGFCKFLPHLPCGWGPGCGICVLLESYDVSINGSEYSAGVGVGAEKRVPIDEKVVVCGIVEFLRLFLMFDVGIARA